MSSKKTSQEVLWENLELFVMCINSDPAFQSELKGTQGWIDLSVGLRSEDDRVEMAVIIKEGSARLEKTIPGEVDATVIFSSERIVHEYLTADTNAMMLMLLKGSVRVDGNLILMGLFEYLLSLLSLDEASNPVQAAPGKVTPSTAEGLLNETQKRRQTRIKGLKVDPGVKYLDDPYLAGYGLEDFPRIEKFREEFFRSRPEMSAEHGKLLTDFYLEAGYDTHKNGSPWDPNLRTAESYRYLMRHKKPVIRKEDLLAGSYTENPVFGTVGHPYAYGPLCWSELRTFHKRALQPYTISKETIETLHKHVFPFWARRNIHELWKKTFNTSLPAQIHERFFAIFFWKSVSIAQNAPDYGRIIKMGTLALIDEIKQERVNDPSCDTEKKNTLLAMEISLDAINIYADHLGEEATKALAEERSPERRKELERMHGILTHIPRKPARTMEEAIQFLMVVHIAAGMEITDDGPPFGRLDQILQPYFEADMRELKTSAEKEAHIKYVIELLGCLFMKQASHEIPSPEIGIWLNSGSPPNATIVVGGVTPEGKDAVNDMSYIILKVTELLRLTDPNVHVRFKQDVNSDVFLKRACDVNYITCATPCIHSDDAMTKALCKNGWPIEDVRDWTPVGCVEPAIPGKHCSSTSSLETNLVAPFEMALNNGMHPLNRWSFGPQTGRIENDDFLTFDDFFNAFKHQCEFIFTQGVVGNNQLGEIYQKHHPAPLLSALTDGCVKKGRGVMRGGAKYNSTGVAITGLADVVDSLMAIKKLVFDEKKISFRTLKKALDDNFENHREIHALVVNKTPRFGSGNPEALEMAKQVTAFIANFHHNQKNYRGGHYATGFWSMSYHTAYGRLTGALPSGRLAGEPFTPGLTPHPTASKNLLDNLMDVAQLDPRTLDNNMAFNVRIVPGATDTHEEAVDLMKNYAATYISQGGMQLQYNVVNTELLKDAMANPQNYPDLMVRISGYCGYFTQLHPDLQREVIRRSEYRL